MSFVISDDFDTVFTLIEHINCSAELVSRMVGWGMDGCMIIGLYCGSVAIDCRVFDAWLTGQRRRALRLSIE